MNLLDSDPVWTEPMGRVAVFAAVHRSVAFLIQSGETNDKALLETVLAQVFLTHPRKGDRQGMAWRWPADRSDESAVETLRAKRIARIRPVRAARDASAGTTR